MRVVLSNLSHRIVIDGEFAVFLRRLFQCLGNNFLVSNLNLSDEIFTLGFFHFLFVLFYPFHIY